MNTESPLFNAYARTLTHEAESAEFNRQLETAFSTIMECPRPDGSQPLDIPDAERAADALTTSAIPEAKQLAQNFVPGLGGEMCITPRIPHDTFEHAKRTVDVFFGNVTSANVTNHQILRLVAMTHGSGQLPDSCGYYIARSRGGIFTFFRLEAEPPGWANPAGAVAMANTVQTWASAYDNARSGGRPNTVLRASEATSKERVALLAELKKAAETMSVMRA